MRKARKIERFRGIAMARVLGVGLGLVASASVLCAQQSADAQGAPRHASARQWSGDTDEAGGSCDTSELGSPYVPDDFWVYPEVLRLYSLGYLDHVFLGMRPWTRASLLEMLDNANGLIEDGESRGDAAAEQARAIYKSLDDALRADKAALCGAHPGGAIAESAYTSVRGISGTPLDDSFHLGQTIINDYGRPYENGLNSDTGASGYALDGRFAAYVRAEIQQAPSATGYSQALAETLSCSIDGICPATYVPLSTIPMGPIASTAHASLLEAYLSYRLLNHEISFGKEDEWLGPGLGGSFAYSNNAENLYAFHIDRIEPLWVPGLSSITGPFRYEFLVGELRGHTLVPNPLYTPGSTTQPNVITPGNPWVHLEKVSFRPTKDLEFGFERTAIFGGAGHQGVSLHSFLRSFFSFTAGTPTQKYSNADPGARFGVFDFSWRLPFLRNWLTLYADGLVHDDISPIDAPHRAAWRPGLYLSHVPGLPKLDIRGEAASTAPPALISGNPPSLERGDFLYWETIERQGYTNQGQIFGDWIGREDKGGQMWITYHLSGNEWLQANGRYQKATTDFIPGGTTLYDAGFQAVKRIGKDVELDGNFTVEHWKAPIDMPGEQMVTTTSIQVTWFPQRRVERPVP